MKINQAQGLQQYQNYVPSVKAEETASFKTLLEEKFAVQNTGNTDKVTISEDAAMKAELGRAATAIGSEINGLGSAQRLAELKMAIDSGGYNVSTAALADAILGVKP